METIELSQRLLKASEYVIKNKPIADIGSDHAYLPIYLVQEGLVSQAIAGEVVSGPYNNAKKKVEEYHLTEQIDVRLGSGLSVLNNEDILGTVFICGMGGSLIAAILQEGLKREKLSLHTRLVLQPNNAEDKLRKFLMENHFGIIHETILIENEKIYEIIIAEYSLDTFHYSEEEIMFGPLLMKEQSSVFKHKWNQEKSNYKRILNQLEQSSNNEKKESFIRKINLIQKVIK